MPFYLIALVAALIATALTLILFPIYFGLTRGTPGALVVLVSEILITTGMYKVYSFMFRDTNDIARGFALIAVAVVLGVVVTTMVYRLKDIDWQPTNIVKRRR